MAVGLIGTTGGQATGGSGGPSTSMDSTGGTLIVIGASWWGMGGGRVVNFSDNKSNTWTTLTVQFTTGGQEMCHQFAYCFSPTVGSGHTFSVTSIGPTYPGFVVHVFSGTSGYTYQTRAGASNNSATSPYSTGSVTPTNNSALLLTGYAVNAGDNPAGLAVTAGFTMTKKAGVGGTCFPSAAAYYVQPTAAAINPAWSWSSGTLETSVEVIVFDSGVSAAPATYERGLRGVGVGVLRGAR